MNDDRETIKLIPKKKKGIFRIVFSRTPIIVLMLALEFMIIFSAYHWLEEYFPPFIALQTVFSIGMIFYLFNCGMDSTAKLTWLAVIMIAPIPGTILLWFTKKDIGHGTIKARIEYLMSDTREKLKQDSAVLSLPELEKSGMREIYKYINNTGCYPVYSNCRTLYFPSGEEKFAVMLSELEKAEKFIFMEYFIIGEGYMWGSILKILADKAKAGVEVRVMYDGMCEMSTLSFDYTKRMEKLGIKCKDFSPIRPFISTHYNYRDHRKILVVDNNVAFTGGVNLADEYINEEERFGHWKDTAVMVEGEAVRSFTLMFLQMWNITEKIPEWDKWVKSEVKPVKAEGFVMPYADQPLDSYKVGESVYMDILYRAKKYVHIMTPYLILDGELETALKYTAQRGVDVRIILPGIPDKKSAYSLAKTHYKSLISAGVKIYEYTPGFVHAKVFVSDDEKAVVGTINLDYRSLYHHFECALYMYLTDSIPFIEEDFQRTVEQCREVTPETIKHEKISYKIEGSILKLFAPLM